MRILFYAHVRNIELFYTQRFYYTDVHILQNIGNEVHTTNNLCRFFYFLKYDSAFLYFYTWSIIPALISKLFGKKVYFTGGIDSLEEGVTSSYKYVINKYLFKLCYLLSTKCIIVSNSDMKNIRKLYHNSLPKISLSHHSIDVERFHSDPLPKEDGMFMMIAWMGSVGNVIRKGMDRAIYVFAELIKRDKLKNSKLVIVGKKGEGTCYLLDIIKKLGICSNVLFTDIISEDEKITLLKKSKYFFQLSIYEGFGIAALEALASEDIVIHSGAGGLQETIKNYGITVKNSADINSSASFIYKEILSFDLNRLKVAYSYLLDNFSDNKREDDLRKLLK
jgi:glycosyltransferase involved in cell wall biosynthesis